MSEMDTVILSRPTASLEEIQQGWHELQLRVSQLEAERNTLEQENKTLRLLLERVIEHRQKSHSELVLLLSGLVSKLPINDVGVIVSRLVEHNSHVSEVCAALAKGKAGAALPQPAVLKALDQTKRELVAAVKQAVEELIELDPPLEAEVLRSWVTKPEHFFSPAAVRANRCFVKGQLPRERIVREFGEAALVFFNDMTTDPRFNPRPKPEEIVLSFKSDFPTLLQQETALPAEKRAQLHGLYEKVQRCKSATEAARLQRHLFLKLSFLLELLHYYENQNTESPEGVFAQRLPALIEQLVVAGPRDQLDEKLIVEAESLLAFVLSHDHRLMVINNVGKGGALGKTLKFVLRLRAEKAAAENPTLMGEIVPDFIKHLIPPAPQRPPPPAELAALLRLIRPELQRLVVITLMSSERLRREEAEALGRAVARELGLKELETEPRGAAALPPELERQMAWERIKELIARRSDPSVIANAIRDRLHTKYDAEEIRQSWLVLIEVDPISLIRIFCQLPYLPDGRTDPVARAAMETYVSRLMHEKYAATYHKVLNSLKNMFRAKPDSPTLVNFLALVRWLDAEAAARMSGEIGMAAAH